MADIVFDDGGQLRALVVDCTTEEVHRLQAVTTDHPVAEGADITDHYRELPDLLSTNIIVSDTPLDANAAVSGSQQTIDLGGGARATVFVPDSPPRRTTEAWELLKSARARKLKATVTTRRGTYESMVLIDAENVVTAADGTWLKVELQWKHIQTVAVELVDAAEPARVRDRSQTQRGPQSTQEASAQHQSVLLRGSQRIGGLLGFGTQ